MTREDILEGDTGSPPSTTTLTHRHYGTTDVTSEMIPTKTPIPTSPESVSLALLSEKEQQQQQEEFHKEVGMYYFYDSKTGTVF